MRPRGTKGAVAILSVFLAGLLQGCPSQSETVSVKGTFVPAAGLNPTDYEIFGLLDTTGSAIGADGSFKTTFLRSRAAIVIAVPRAGSASAARLAPETGMYMTPALGAHRVSGQPYAVTDSKTAVMDATTTVLSMLLMHPEMANPEPEAARGTVEWMLEKLKAGWPALSTAAALYDQHLAQGSDFSTDDAFVSALESCLTEAAAGLAERAAGSTSMTLGSSRRAVEKLDVAVSRGAVAVSEVTKISSDSSTATVKPGTETGTALDYLYVVRPLPASEFPGWTSAPEFKQPDMLKVREWGSPVASGFVPARSYAKYIDVVGSAMKFATAFWSIPIAPSEGVVLEGPRQIYEVRFFSGGLVGVTGDDLAFANAHFPSDDRSALLHNLVAGAVEGIGLIPGSEALFSEELGGQILQEGVTQLTAELETLITGKRIGNITADDLYGLMYNTAKAIVDKACEKLVEAEQKGVWRRFVAWAGWGGKKVVRTIMSLPGKLAKGGSLANRAARLLKPYSIMEYWLVAVGAEEPAKADGGAPGRPVVDGLSGSTEFKADPFHVAVAVSGGEPPYSYAWYGITAPAVLLEGPEYSEVFLPQNQLRCSGTCQGVRCCCVWVTVTDSDGDEAVWTDEVGTPRNQFAYCVDINNVVTTEPPSFPY